MAEFGINRGIGKPIEFKGLRSQYLFIFAGGLLAIFIVFVILYMAGVGHWICIGFGVCAGVTLVTMVFRLNAKYGPHGIMKLTAVGYHPRYIINRRRITNLIRIK